MWRFLLNKVLEKMQESTVNLYPKIVASNIWNENNFKGTAAGFHVFERPISWPSHKQSPYTETSPNAANRESSAKNRLLFSRKQSLQRDM